MKRSFCFAVAGLVAAPVLAGTGLHKVDNIGYLTYDMRSGELRKADGAQSLRGGACWDSTCSSGYFTGAEDFEVMLDWGDADTACLGAITSFQIGYASNHAAPQTIDIIFSSSDNGFCDTGRTPEVAFRITGLPGQGPFPFTGWVVTILPVSPIDLSASADLDSDGLGDFSYSYHFRTPHDGVTQVTGPLLSGNPTCGSTGQEDAFDLYVADPNSSVGPNDLLIPDDNAICDGTYWFGGPPAPFAGFHLLLGDPNGGGSACSSCPGDIEPPGGDNDVDLTDLAVMLGNFGTLSGATCDDGDIEPPGGDGDVDLTDLAILLGAYGQPCP